MMRKPLAALAVFSLFAASVPAIALATTSIKGSTVFVPPLISMKHLDGARSRTVVMRLPAEAGEVSMVVTTNLVSKSESYIAKGDKYYSLCMPNRQMIACAPIVATAIMQGIEVGAHVDDKGAPLVTFRIDPAAKLTPMRVAYSINYFLTRIHTQVEHFNRMVMNYAPLKGVPPLKAGIASALSAVGGGGGCRYDDFGSYDCTGGDSGYEGGGYDGSSYDWSGDDNGGSGDAGSGSTSVPTFPSGNVNGDKDPCIDASGANICQQVVITGERPDVNQQVSLPTCRALGGFIECDNITPPVIGGDPTEQIPRGPTPWLPQGACDFASVFCSAGQVPSTPEPPLTDFERTERAKQQCWRQATAMRAYCKVEEANLGWNAYSRCLQNASAFARECDLIGTDGL